MKNTVILTDHLWKTVIMENPSPTIQVPTWIFDTYKLLSCVSRGSVQVAIRHYGECCLTTYSAKLRRPSSILSKSQWGVIGPCLVLRSPPSTLSLVKWGSPFTNLLSSSSTVPYYSPGNQEGLTTGLFKWIATKICTFLRDMMPSHVELGILRCSISNK